MTSLLSNSMLDTQRLEQLIYGGFVCGGCLLVVHLIFGKAAKRTGGRIEKMFVEFQRKAFHMIGGCIICSCYHWGIKHKFIRPAFSPETDSTAMDGGAAFLAASFVCWIVEASRLTIPAVQTWYLKTFKGLIRQKEHSKAAGIAYFLPGALAAIGTAGGYIPVGTSSRKVEGSIGCFLVCTFLAIYAGLSSQVALIACSFVTFGELLAEIIGLDDNFVIPILGVLGVRIGLFPQLGQMAALMGVSLGIGVALAAIVGSTTSKEK